MPHPRFPVAVHVLLLRGDDVLLVRRLELVWADVAALPSDTIAYVRAGIESFREGVWFQEFGWEPAGADAG